MTVFISEKDLSPTSNTKDRWNLNNRIQEINCLHQKEEDKKQIKEDVASKSKEIVVNDQSKNKSHMPNPSTAISQEEIMQKLNFLKEPEINYNQLLNQKIESDTNEANNQNIDEINNQTDEIENYVYQMILDEVYSEMYPQRVIVPFLKQKFIDDIDWKHSSSKEESSDSETSISHTNTELQISDTTLDQDSELCLRWDSQNTLKYVKQIVQE